MTHQEKATDLLNKFSSLNQWVGGEGNISLGTKMAKQCAIICVEQILEWERLNFGQETAATKYWKEVIEHLKSS